MRYADEVEKRELRAHLAEYLVQAGMAKAEEIERGKLFPCPDPGHNDDDPSARYYEGPDQPHVYCFGCRGCWDLFQVIGMNENLPDFEQQIERARQLYGSERTTDNQAVYVPKIRHEQAIPKPPTAEEIQAVKDYITECQQNLHKTNYYQKRGLTDAFARQAGLGYDPKTYRLIIPTDNAYVARTVLPYENVRRYDNRKNFPISLTGGEAIHHANNVFVVEGAFDALSIRQAGAQAISLNSISNAKKLVNLVKAEGSEAHFIVALDNDEAGLRAGKDLGHDLQEAGAQAKIIHEAWGTHKDAGEYLQQEGNKALKDRLKQMAEMNREDYAEIKQDNETYDQMYHRLKEQKPEHAAKDLLEYWGKVIMELRETSLQIHRAEKQCQVLKLWQTAVEMAAKEFNIKGEEVELIKDKLQTLAAQTQNDVKTWQGIYESMTLLDEYSNNLIETVMVLREENPLFKLPEVQHAMDAEDALKEPPKQKPDIIYYALLKAAAMSRTGLLPNEADQIIVQQLQERKKGLSEITKCLLNSPCLKNAPEEKRQHMAETMVKNIDKEKDKDKGGR